MNKDVYSIPREEAAESLRVSTRTLDRYLRKGKLKFKVDGRNVFIHEKELAELKFKLEKKQKSAPRKEPREMPTQRSETESFTFQSAPNHSNHSEEKVFRELYAEASAELKAKQEKLEAASFRVGQLETQLKNSVPLLEYKQHEEQITQEITILKTENVELKTKLVSENTKTKIFLIAAIVTLAVALILGGLLLWRGDSDTTPSAKTMPTETKTTSVSK